MIQAELLTETTELHFRRMLTNSDIGFQEKFNGHRLIICKQNGTLRCFNREGEPSSKPLPLLVKNSLLRHPLATFVIDGELVAGNQAFHIFDVLVLGDKLLNEETYEHREKCYHAEFSSYAGLHPVTTARAVATKERLWWLVQKTQGEGLVAKNMTKMYRPGRSDQHWKLKFIKSADAIVIGPSPEGKDSVEIGMLDAHGRMHRISGLSLRSKYRVQPGTVLEVKFLYATKTLHIVQPVLVRVRTDKRAIDCKLTQLIPYINKNWVKVELSSVK